MNPKTVVDEVPPYLRVYQDGTIERLVGTDFAPPTLDPETGVSSKDVLFHPETGVSARLYRPNLAADHRTKLPLVIYFHGGAFCISSTADPKYHAMLNILVNHAQIILVSVDYRLAPEHPLPAAYHDSWAALQWVAAHLSGAASENWITEHVDFDRVFLAGDSAGANISHHLSIRVGSPGRALGELKIRGVLMIQPYFWGEEAIGAEAENPVFKAVVDKWWRFVCPSDLGCDDPLINPFASGAPSLDGLGCGRVLVCVAGNDIRRSGRKRQAPEEAGAAGAGSQPSLLSPHPLSLHLSFSLHKRDGAAALQTLAPRSAALQPLAPRTRTRSAAPTNQTRFRRGKKKKQAAVEDGRSDRRRAAA